MWVNLFCGHGGMLSEAGQGEAELRITNFETTPQCFITSLASIPSGSVRKHT